MRTSIALIGLLGFWPLFALAQTTADFQPEDATGTTEQKAVIAEEFMIVAANPYASRAGYEVLADGGSATDALIAAQLVLNLVEPQSSGIGGGGFMIHWDARREQVTTYDGRETSPLNSPDDIFAPYAGGNGTPRDFTGAALGGKSTGTPSLVQMMEMAHEEHGRLRWARLFEPAIALAQDGFVVSPRLAALIERDAERLKRHPSTAGYFFKEDGSPLVAGDVLRNPEFAESLQRVAEFGGDAFRSGPIVDAIVGAVQNDEEGFRGFLSHEDFALYEPLERPAVCGFYRTYRICGMGPPSSGGITVIQILGLLEHFDLASLEPSSARATHLFIEALRLAFADRAIYIADPAFGPTPGEGLIDQAYLTARAQLIGLTSAMETVAPGNPPWRSPRPLAPDTDPRPPGTTHISVVDARGNIAAATTTIMAAFGNRVMAGGFLLNNEQTNFAFIPTRDGLPVANRMEPGKRPLSAMAPTIVFDAAGAPVMVIGSPGGPAIIPYTAKTIIGVLDWGLDIQEAIELPHIAVGFGRTALETSPEMEAIVPELESIGHTPSLFPLNSGLHGITLFGGQLVGGADPRREGLALGE